MTILVKRIYEPAAKSDGFRVLVDRLWPRGIAKEAAKLDLWLPEIGPSTELRKWFNHDPDKWEEFRRRYHVELKEKKEPVAELKGRAKEGTVTLLYSAKDEAHNQSVALQDFLLRRKEGLQRNRQDAAEVVRGLRKRSATLRGEKIVTAVRRDRGR